jgi:hypothetical protein
MGCDQGFDWVLLGQPGRRVNPSDQPGHTKFFFSIFFQPGITCQAGPDFKTMVEMVIHSIKR